MRVQRRGVAHEIAEAVDEPARWNDDEGRKWPDEVRIRLFDRQDDDVVSPAACA